MNSWRVNSTLPSDEWALGKKNQKEKKFLQLNENENTTKTQVQN